MNSKGDFSISKFDHLDQHNLNFRCNHFFLHKNDELAMTLLRDGRLQVVLPSVQSPVPVRLVGTIDSWDPWHCYVAVRKPNQEWLTVAYVTTGCQKAVFSGKIFQERNIVAAPEGSIFQPEDDLLLYDETTGDVYLRVPVEVKKKNNKNKSKKEEKPRKKFEISCDSLICNGDSENGKLREGDELLMVTMVSERQDILMHPLSPEERKEIIETPTRKKFTIKRNIKGQTQNPLENVDVKVTNKFWFHPDRDGFVTETQAVNKLQLARTNS